MDPVVGFLLALGTFIVGLFVGWKWRELHLWKEIKEGTFDPVRWGSKGDV